MLTRDRRDGEEQRVEMRSEWVLWLPKSAGIRSRWPAEPAAGPQAQAEPAQNRTNPEEALAFEITNALRGRRHVDGPRPSGKCPLRTLATTALSTNLSHVPGTLGSGASEGAPSGGP